MWSIEDIEVVPVELDFSSSGQRRIAATAIEAEGVRLVNAIELVEVEPGATQVEVCECCGFPRCSSGGWIAFRRIGERVIWIPAWDEMEEGTWEASEYQPPSFLETKGAPVFSAACWERMRALLGGLPCCGELPWINSRETARLCQWSAPGRLLRDFPSVPRVRRDLVIAVTDGDVATESEVVDQCLQDHFGAVHQMELVPSHLAMSPIEFWLDLPGFPSWKSLARVEDRVSFVIDGSTALVRAG